MCWCFGRDIARGLDNCAIVTEAACIRSQFLKLYLLSYLLEIMVGIILNQGDHLFRE